MGVEWVEESDLVGLSQEVVARSGESVQQLLSARAAQWHTASGARDVPESCRVCMCVRACVHACVRAYRACVRACVVCVCVYVCVCARIPHASRTQTMCAERGHVTIEPLAMDDIEHVMRIQAA